MEEFTTVTQLASNLYEGLYTLDTDRRITRWNTAAKQITGYSPEEVIGSKCSDNILVHVDSEGCELCENNCPVSACMEDGRFREAEVFFHHKMGHRVPVQVRVFPSRDTGGEIRGAIELFVGNDSLELMSSRIRVLESQVLTDLQTKLPSRRYIEDGIEANISLYNRLSIPFSVVFIDVDDMKVINDKYGHNAGDKLLKTVARTISSCARPSDIIGRWGGDEFVGYLPGSNLEEALNLAQRLSRLIGSSSVAISGDEDIKVTVSIGVSLINDNDTLFSIVDKADKLMYKVKLNGGNGVCSELA